MVGVAGCLGRRGDPALPDGMDVETRHWVADVLDRGILDRRTADGGMPAHHYAVVGDRAAARTRIDADGTGVADDVEGFVRDTAFGRSYLLVVQDLQSPEEWLALRSVERTDGGLAVEVLVDADTGSPVDSLAPHSLAVRVTDDRAGTPGELDVTVDA